MTPDGSRDGKRRGGSKMVLDLAANLDMLDLEVGDGAKDHLHVRVCHPRRQ